MSDSTIYNAYYTIAHLIQGNSFKGDKINALNIKAKDLTPEVWDYIFFKTAPKPNTTIPVESLNVSILVTFISTVMQPISVINDAVIICLF